MENSAGWRGVLNFLLATYIIFNMIERVGMKGHPQYWGRKPFSWNPLTTSPCPEGTSSKPLKYINDQRRNREPKAE